MNRTTMMRRALLTGAAAVTILGLAAGCGDNGGTDHGATNMSAPSTSGTSTFNDQDVAFAQMMIPHHQQAVEMATLAETRASGPEIKQLAAKIKAAQSPEITTMTGWLTAWGKPTTGGHDMPGMSSTEGMPGMMSDHEMAELNDATGVDFDRMFARMMIAHHNGAIQNAKEEKAHGVNAEAKALAATIEQAQTAEVATLQTILDRL